MLLKLKRHLLDSSPTNQYRDNSHLDTKRIVLRMQSKFSGSIISPNIFSSVIRNLESLLQRDMIGELEEHDIYCCVDIFVSDGDTQISQRAVAISTVDLEGYESLANRKTLEHWLYS